MEHLGDLVVFLKVVEKGGISAAATALKLSPSLVSRRLRRLEAELGVQLINRSTRHISLTDAGLSLHNESAPAISALEAARANAVRLSDEPIGNLRIHTAVGIGQWVVSEAAAIFKHEYPDVSIDLSIDSDRENLLRDGFDVIVKTSRLNDSSLQCREFRPVHHIVVASPVYLKKHGRPTEPRDLVNHSCLIQYGRRAAGDWKFRGTNGQYTVKVTGSFRSNSAAAIGKAAARGLGIALVPEYVVFGRSYEKQLSVIFDECVVPIRQIFAYYPRAPHMPAKLRAFLECLNLADANRIRQSLSKKR